MKREQIEEKYDEFFGTGYWEEQYKKHIVEFAFQCSNSGKPMLCEPKAEPLPPSNCYEQLCRSCKQPMDEDEGRWGFCNDCYTES